MIIDLTFNHNTIYQPLKGKCVKIKEEEIPLKSANTSYTGVIYDFLINSMAGTYIDFPGHIKESDNGEDSQNYKIEKLYRRNATIIHLNRESDSGGVTAEELKEACYTTKIKTPIVIINALGEKQFNEIKPRSVFLTIEAVEWIVSQGVEIVISDIYESQDIEGVFLKLFENNISTVCNPINLYKLSDEQLKISLFFLKMKTVTQIPCRIIAELKK